MTRVLIIGGTGMLAKATRLLAERYDRAVLIARNPALLARQINATAHALDWRDRDTVFPLFKKMTETPFDLVLSWLHEDGLWCVPHLEALLRGGGRSLRVYGSSISDPAGGITTDRPLRSDIKRQYVVLGWMIENGRRRWLTNDEISDGVIDAYDQPEKSAYIVGQLT